MKKNDIAKFKTLDELEDRLKAEANVDIIVFLAFMMSAACMFAVTVAVQFLGIDHKYWKACVVIWAIFVVFCLGRLLFRRTPRCPCCKRRMRKVIVSDEGVEAPILYVCYYCKAKADSQRALIP